MLKPKFKKRGIQLAHRTSPSLTHAEKQLLFAALEPNEECNCTLLANCYGVYLGIPGSKWNKSKRRTIACITQNHNTATYHLKLFEFVPQSKKQVSLIGDIQLFTGLEFHLHTFPDSPKSMICFTGQKYGLGVQPADVEDQCTTFSQTVALICGMWHYQGKPPDVKTVDNAVRNMKNEAIETALVGLKTQTGQKRKELGGVARAETGWANIKGRGKLLLHVNPYDLHSRPRAADPAHNLVPASARPPVGATISPALQRSPTPPRGPVVGVPPPVVMMPPPPPPPPPIGFGAPPPPLLGNIGNGAGQLRKVQQTPPSIGRDAMLEQIRQRGVVLKKAKQESAKGRGKSDEAPRAAVGRDAMLEQIRQRGVVLKKAKKRESVKGGSNTPSPAKKAHNMKGSLEKSLEKILKSSESTSSSSSSDEDWID